MPPLPRGDEPEQGRLTAGARRRDRARHDEASTTARSHGDGEVRLGSLPGAAAQPLLAPGGAAAGGASHPLRHSPSRRFFGLDESPEISLLYRREVSPDGREGSLPIHQNAFLSFAKFGSNDSFSYDIHKAGNGVYVFVVRGEIEIDGETLGTRDAMGVAGLSEFELTATAASEVLLIEVPMR